MKAAQLPKPGADFEIVEHEIPQAGPRQVRIRFRACEVCRSDVVTNFSPGAAWTICPDVVARQGEPSNT